MPTPATEPPNATSALQPIADRNGVQTKTQLYHFQQENPDLNWTEPEEEELWASLALEQLDKLADIRNTGGTVKEMMDISTRISFLSMLSLERIDQHARAAGLR